MNWEIQKKTIKTWTRTKFVGLSLAAIIFFGVFGLTFFTNPNRANACVAAGAAAMEAVEAAAATDSARGVPISSESLQLGTSIAAGAQAAQTEKECVENGIAYMVAKVVISNITQSIVTWINSGFQGSPAFVSNPESYFTDVADQIAGNFIAGGELGFMCEPFSLDIRLALNLSYNSTFTQRNFCRLSDVISNAENFTKFTQGDFSKGGWDSWFEVSQNPSNNPIGAYVAAETELKLRTARGKEVELTKLNWGKGFLSFRECLAQDQNGKCVEHGEIQTPGAVIEGQLENMLGTGVRQLELADEFNEIVGALVGQLVQTVLTKGLSSFGPSGSNYASLQQTTENGLAVYCSPSVRIATIGQSVTWTTQVGGGLPGNPTYSWSGHTELQGRTSQSVTVSYFDVGEKRGAVAVAKGGQNIFTNCTASVLVQ